MNNQIETFTTKQQITFYDQYKNPLKIEGLTLNITKQEQTVQQCQLTFQVHPELYQKIEKSALFNLKPEARYSSAKIKFLPDCPITINVELQKSLLLEVANHGNNAEEITNYILKLGEQADINNNYNSLILTENWYCLTVKQQQGEEEIGYRTVWDYIKLDKINQVADAGSYIVESLVNFIQESTDITLGEINQKNSDLGKIFNDFFTELEKFNEDENIVNKLSDVMLDFFAEDDWEFVQLEEMLQMSFQGENGRWTCYAKAADEDEQFIFYSVCPLNAEETQLIKIAEFITKVNYGLIIGNFELDFSDGEIRYKTSIDVEEDRLTTALIKQLVYANVLTMDRYLPGIVAVLNNLSVDEAIAQCE